MKLVFSNSENSIDLPEYVINDVQVKFISHAQPGTGAIEFVSENFPYGIEVLVKDPFNKYETITPLLAVPYGEEELSEETIQWVNSYNPYNN